MSGVGPAPFSLTTSEDGERFVLTAGGELDLATAPELERLVMPLVREGREVVVDLRGLDFMDSSGVRILIAAHAAAEESGGRFLILRTEPGSPVQRVLEISGLEGLLAIIDPE
jgi:anti-anti-sigma factor